MSENQEDVSISDVALQNSGSLAESTTSTFMAALIGALTCVGIDLGIKAFVTQSKKREEKEQLESLRNGDETGEKMLSSKKTEEQLELKLRAMLSHSEYIGMKEFEKFSKPLAMLANIYQGEFVVDINPLIRNIDRILCMKVQLKNKRVEPQPEKHSTQVWRYHSIVAQSIDTLLNKVFVDPNHTSTANLSDGQINAIRKACVIIRELSDQHVHEITQILDTKK